MHTNIHSIWGEPEQAPHRQEACADIVGTYVSVMAVSDKIQWKSIQVLRLR